MIRVKVHNTIFVFISYEYQLLSVSKISHFNPTFHLTLGGSTTSDTSSPTSLSVSEHASTIKSEPNMAPSPYAGQTVTSATQVNLLFIQVPYKYTVAAEPEIACLLVSQAAKPLHPTFPIMQLNGIFETLTL